MAIYIRKRSAVTVVQPSFACGSERDDIPYLTQHGTVFNSAGISGVYSVGKISTGSAQLDRLRRGFAFKKSLIYPSGGPVRFKLRGTLALWENTLETFAPKVFLSDTDDHALYISGSKAAWDWEANLNHDLVPLSYGVPEQYVALDMAWLAAFAGAYVCFVVGIDTEMADAGLGGGHSANALFDPGDCVMEVG